MGVKGENLGNSNGLLSSLSSRGKNIRTKFNGGYFCFAHDDEVALVLDNIKGYYFILNCTEKLFNECKKGVNSGATRDQLIKFWKAQSKIYEISDWSNNFKDLK